MRCELSLPGPLLGVSLANVKPGDPNCQVACTEFVSSEDGDILTSRLENLASAVIGRAPGAGNLLPSTISHMLAIIDNEGHVQLFINEPPVLLEVQSKTNVVAGQPIGEDDIADICSHRFQGVEVPPDRGVLYYFTAGWRRGFFYDLAPLGPDPRVREFDLHREFARLHAYLLFQELFRTSEDEWERLLEQQWFPFIALPVAVKRQLLNHLRAGWDLDEHLPTIRDLVTRLLPDWQAKWRKLAAFADHVDLLDRGARRFLVEDYVSSISILYPRIEGILRSAQLIFEDKVNGGQSGLAATAERRLVATGRGAGCLLPQRFRAYLSRVYFANFDPREGGDLSRNSVAHGVAKTEDFDCKRAVLGWLIIEQLSYALIDAKQDVSST